MNKLQIRRKDVNREDGGTGPLWGGLIEVLINGNVISGWTAIKLNIKPDEFVVADLEFSVNEIEVDNDVYFSLEAIAREGGRVIVRQQRDGKVRFEAQDVPNGDAGDDYSDVVARTPEDLDS